MRNVLICIACLLLFVSFASAREEYQEYAWIMGVNKDTGVVEIQTVASKISISFEPASAEDIQWFAGRVGYIAAAKFDCAEPEKEEENCDGSKSYVFSADKKTAKVVGWRFLHKPREAQVAYGPGDEKGDYPKGLIIDGKIGNNDFLLDVRFVDPTQKGPIAKMKRGDKIKIEFSEDDPRIIRISGVEMYITIIKISEESADKP